MSDACGFFAWISVRAADRESPCAALRKPEFAMPLPDVASRNRIIEARQPFVESPNFETIPPRVTRHGEVLQQFLHDARRRRICSLDSCGGRNGPKPEKDLAGG